LRASATYQIDDASPGNARRIVKVMIDDVPQFSVPLALCS
jgi:hypothetical protein